MLPEVSAFGERLACDFIIVSKARTEGRDNVVLVVRDEFSGFIRAFPLGSRSSENINKHLLAFLGPSYYKQPSIMVKSDQAHEFQASCSHDTRKPLASQRQIGARAENNRRNNSCGSFASWFPHVSGSMAFVSDTCSIHDFMFP